MAKTYIPTVVKEAHKLAVFVAKNNAILLAAIAAVDPAAVPLYETLAAALAAFDAQYQTLYPIED